MQEQVRQQAAVTTHRPLFRNEICNVELPYFYTFLELFSVYLLASPNLNFYGECLLEVRLRNCLPKKYCSSYTCLNSKIFRVGTQLNTVHALFR